MRPAFAILVSALTLGSAAAPALAQSTDPLSAAPEFTAALPSDTGVSSSDHAADLVGNTGEPWPSPEATDWQLAQYFDNGSGGPNQGAGYFPDVPRESVGDLLLTTTYIDRPVLGAFHLGVGLGAMSLAKVDDSFFTPNESDSFGLTLPATFEAGGYMEFAGLARVGLVGNGFFAAARNRGVSGGSFGMSLEFGGGDVWRFWGGGVIGGRWLNADAQDEIGRDYGWNARFIQYRLHGHVERQLNPWVSLRLTPWVGLGTLRDETFDVPQPRDAPSNVIPGDSGYREISGGLLFTVVLGTGR
jgi:hypothetical protein